MIQINDITGKPWIRINEGEYIKDAHGNNLFMIKDEYIRDAAGNNVGMIKEGYIKDAIGNNIYMIKGSYIKDVAGNNIYMIKDGYIKDVAGNNYYMLPTYNNNYSELNGPSNDSYSKDKFFDDDYDFFNDD